MDLEPINKFSYTRDWTKPADFPTFEDDEKTVREDMQYQPNELKEFINDALVAFINDSLIPLVNALVAGTIPPDSVYTAAIQNGAVTLEKLGDDVTAVSLGALAKVNGVEPDTSGNVTIRGGDIAMSDADSTTVSGAIVTKQTLTELLSVENGLEAGDYVPFYDVSATTNRKTPWSNIVSKIRSALFGTASGFLKANGSGVVSAAPIIGTDDIADGAVTGQKIADKTITAANMADKTITAAQIANDTISATQIAALGITAGCLANNIPYTKFGLTSNQVRTITAGTAAPSGGSDGDIYIKY